MMGRAGKLLRLSCCAPCLLHGDAVSSSSFTHGKLVQEVLELRVSKSVLESVRSEFAGLRTEFAGLRSDVASNAATLNAKVESSSTALKETMKVREGGFLLKVVAAVAGTMGFMEVLGYQNGKSA